MQRSNDGDGRTKNSGRVAGFVFARTGFGKDAAEARAEPGRDRELHPAAGDHTSIYQRDSVLDREVVQQIPGFEIVGAVEDDGGLSRPEQQLLRIVGVDVRNVRKHLDRRIDSPDTIACGDRLGLAHDRVFLLKEHLPLQVAPFDDVAIENREPPYPGARELIENAAAERPASNHDRVRAHQRTLSGIADSRQDGLTRIPIAQTV